MLLNYYVKPRRRKTTSTLNFIKYCKKITVGGITPIFIHVFVVWQERTEMHIFDLSPLHKSEIPCTFSTEFSSGEMCGPSRNGNSKHTNVVIVIVIVIVPGTVSNININSILKY